MGSWTTPLREVIGMLAAPMTFSRAAGRRMACAVLLVVSFQAAAQETALDRYVAEPDSHFKYELANTIAGDGYTAYVLDMTSQQYLTAAEVNHPVWRHWLTVVKPAKVTSNVGLLFIRGGANSDGAPEAADPLAARIATMTGSVVAVLKMVPSQPLVFAGETRERVEDAIIAYTWDKYLRTGDEKWPLRLPMTKAAVRAMDAVSGFVASAPGGGAKVDKFVVSGESKRGWTTWTTAAVDKRVVGIMPCVIDLLNIGPSFLHHYRVYGTYSSEVDDYVQAGIMKWAGTEEYRNLMQIVEPFSYRDRLTMPKFIINAAGDEYFLPDSWQFYFDRLPGEKYLRYVPNAQHAIRDHTDVEESIAAYFEAIVKQTPRPTFTWKIRKNGQIVVDAVTAPSAVKLWQATNPRARDFRLANIGPAYTSTDLAPVRAGHYVGTVKKPSKGYTAYFIELTFPSGGAYPFKFTTGVKVIPDTYPFPAPKADPPAGSHPVN